MEDEMSAFCMMFCLTLHQVLASLTKAAFRLKDGRESMAHEAQHPGDKRRRYSKKAPPEEGEGSRHFTLLAFCSRARYVVDKLWQTLFSRAEDFSSTIFGVAAVYWPTGHHSSKMFQRMTKDILKTQANLTFRVLSRYDRIHCGPLSFLDLMRLDAAENPEQLASDSLKALMEARECCLDQSWGLPVMKDVAAQPDDESKLKTLQHHVTQFDAHARGVSLREETMHRYQREFAGSGKAKATLFAKQAASMVITESMHNYDNCCPGASANASASTKAALQDVRQGRVIHRRPRNLGNPVFHFMSQRKQQVQGISQDEILAEWNAMSQDEKTRWTAQHRIQVSKKRASERWAKEQREEQEARLTADTPSRSPWKVGTDKYPLHEKYVTEYLRDFRSRECGIQKLSDVDHELTQLQVQRLLEGAKYHGMDAATTCARASFSNPIDLDAATQSTWQKLASTAQLQKSCWECHPGLCKTQDAELLNQISVLWGHLPREDTLLMLQRTGGRANQRVVVFARLVTGLLGTLLADVVSEVYSLFVYS